MLTRCWQLEFQRPTFASVMPGITDTAMMDTIRSSENMAPDKLDFFQNLKQNDKLILPDTVALFLCWLLLDTEQSEYGAKEWDIYDVTHHVFWLPSTHVVPSLE